MEHDHPHLGSGTIVRLAPARVVLVALVANTLLAVVQVGFGLILGSISLLADSVHQVTDVVGLAIALVAITFAAAGVTRRGTWGWGRADVLGALLSSLLLLGSSAWIVIESVRRLMDPHDIDGVGVLIVALVGLVVNSVSAVALSGHHSLATRAAFVHLVGDAAGSAGVLVAAVAVITVDATWVDPVVAVAIAGWVAWSGWHLLRSSTRVLMNLVPPEVEATDVAATVGAVAGIEEVHHLHVWEVVPGETAVSAHVVVAGDTSVHESQLVLGRVRDALLERHGIGHGTFEVECHPCDDAEHGEPGSESSVST